MLLIYVYNVVSLSADQSSYLSRPYRWDFCPRSDSPFVVASIDTQVYPIVGLKPPYLARCPTIVPFDLLSLSTTPLLLLLDLVGLLSSLSVRELIIDSRTPTTSRTLSLYAA